MRLSKLGVLRSYFRWVGAVSPGLAAGQAFALAFAPPSRATDPRCHDVWARAERFFVDSGAQRVAVYRWPANGRPRNGIVVLAHGWGSNASLMWPWVEPLLAEGIEVVAFDMPAHGESGGKRTNGLEMAWAVAAVAAEVGPIRAFVGHSAGAFAAAMATAGDHLVERSPVEVDHLVLIAPVDNPQLHIDAAADLLQLRRRTRERLHRRAAREFGRPMAAFSLSQIPGAWKQSTLILHDPADPEMPFSQANAIAEVLPRVRLAPINEAGHHRIARREDVIEQAIQFLVASDE